MAQRVQTWDYDSRTWYTNPETGLVEEYVYRRPEVTREPGKPEPGRLYVHPVERLYELRPHEFGPLMWRQLHARPFEVDGDLSREAGWLEQMHDASPCPTCQYHFRLLYTAHPPNLKSPEHYHCWGWMIHHEVNKILGKRIVPWQPEWGPEPT